MSSKKQAKGKEKDSDKPKGSDDDDGDEELEEEDPAQLLESQQKHQRAIASHFDANPDDSDKDEPKKKAKTAATGGPEFKPPPRPGGQSSRGTVASQSGTSTVARGPGCRLAKVAAREEEVSHN